ncbi:hypothetical protein NUU61_001657 [Penicillium alfredii]|uniref:MINDY deubiquitinase domain-containing protein n=1 Tax=Penicillium alfredii TaxID=1506179 RepID=A0A9W9KF98_9EURO|nr:uncharacterized protein NUU61_001657 [Penicillium alfredii]KAJ5104310.1 hypothetical protein NUU61_001657 [Penicillium alfredii]
MVLRKQPPPRLENLSKGNARPESRSPTSPPPNSASSSRRARLNRIPSEESVYSPDLNTSPAFDLMPLEEAQRPQVGSPTSHPKSWPDQPGGTPDHSGSYEGPHPPPAGNKGQLVPSALFPGQQQEGEVNGWQPTQEARNSPRGSFQPSEPDQDTQDQHDWNGRNSHAVSSNSELSQTDGYIPMTARLSLLDSEQETSWTGPSQSPAQPFVSQSQSLENQSPWAAQPSARVSTPQQIYLQGGQSNPYAPAVVVQPSDQRPEDPYDDQQLYNPERLGSDAGINTPSATFSSATSATSHELIDLDVPSTLAAETGSRRPASSVYSSDAPDAKRDQAASPAPEMGSSVTPQLNAATGQIPGPGSNTGISAVDATRQKEQRSETYSIRHIRWMNQSGQLLESPVLVQNENGPCPLLALINALVLRADTKTQPPIVKALQTRENISLGLLIEALFEELTTCLRPDEEFPDIEALTQFLTMLHTGMNVNPRLTLESTDSLGTFFQTSDLRLYSTFGVSLIHGWLASWSSSTHAAMSRVAQYHEDIQLLPFRKQELEDRVMRDDSLSPQEEETMEDIQTIQRFVEIENATQLSPFGLTQLTTQLAPGSVSILFRNDHFSTLYKHPESCQLFTLVTDAGYANHAEVVWESLVDVTGFNSEFLSGDFRAVSQGQTETSGPAGPRSSSAAVTAGATASGEEHKDGFSTQEQRDADYAYALSLQFQEEERRETQNSNRGPRASQPVRASNRSSPRITVPNRTSSVANHGSQPHNGTDPDDPNAPPPTYEQAANSPRYSPTQPRFPSARNRYSSNRTSRSNWPRATAGGPIRPNEGSKDCVMM